MEDLIMISRPSAIDSPSIQELLVQRDNFKYDVGGQRAYVWDYNRKVKLILSLFQNIRLGIITANVNGKDIEVADGQQRLNTIFLFFSNEFKLPDNTVLRLNLDGEFKDYDLSNMYFKDLPELVRVTLLSKIVRIEKYFGLNENEVNVIMQRLNNGRALTNAEKTRMENFGSIGNFIDEIENMELFQRKVNITKSSKEKLLMCSRVIQSILAFECNIIDVSITNYSDICKEIRENNLLTEDIRMRVRETFNYMESIFPAHKKYLTHENIISIYLFLKEVKEFNLDERKVLEIIDKFYEVYKEYGERKDRTTRLSVLNHKELLVQYFEDVLDEEKLV